VAVLLVALSASTPAASAEPRFEACAGLEGTGATYGASFGDFDGDGLPDLWVGNHNRAPNLYLNLGERRFRDVTATVWRGDPFADTHGAAWADFDRDGDEDLVEVVAASIGGGSMCVGCARNHLWVNEGGVLTESAAYYGLDLEGTARSPLWLDADLDGDLDLIVVNRRKPGSPRSSLQLQDGGRFKPAPKGTGLTDRPFTEREYYERIAFGLLDLEWRKPTEWVTRMHHEYAQLADLDGDAVAEVILFSQPVRIYRPGPDGLEEITGEAGLPNLQSTGDVAAGDFDGDGITDLFATAGPYRTSDVLIGTDGTLRSTILAHKRGDPVEGAKGFRFVAGTGTVTFTIAPDWLALDKVFIGTPDRQPQSRTFTLAPAQAQGDPLADGRAGIAFDPAAGGWVVRNAVPGEYVDFVVTAEAGIKTFERIGFEPFAQKGRDVVLKGGAEGFRAVKGIGELGEPSACHSVVTGDFDNDMDLDLYLTCSEPIRNLPNRLFLNDGQGNCVHAATSGAEGSDRGRSDAVATADIDRDGFLDLFIANGSDPTSPFVEDGPHELLCNTPNGNRWLEIDLAGGRSNVDGTGAVVTVVAGGVRQYRVQDGGMHRFTQNHKRLHFGLGTHQRANVTVRWPNGATQTLTDVVANQIIRIEERT
jgi:hypothetical protein